MITTVEGMHYGIRLYPYGAAEVYWKHDSNVQTAFLQGDEAYDLYDKADCAQTYMIRDAILSDYIDFNAQNA